MSDFSMWFAFAFVLIALFLSTRQKLGMGKEIVIGTVRCTVQLLVIGYVLQFVFHSDNSLFVVLFVMMMVFTASWNASRRGAHLKGIFWRILLSLSMTEVVTMGSMVAVGLVTPSPQYLIPMSGMIRSCPLSNPDDADLFFRSSRLCSHDQLAELSPVVYK